METENLKSSIEIIKNKPCDCKGKRTCLLCENDCERKRRGASIKEYQEHNTSYVFCISCQRIFSGWDSFESCADHEGLAGKDFPGMLIVNDFLSPTEGSEIATAVDNQLGWDASQSGRRKKNYGPKVNFKKKKLSVGKFSGFPKPTQFVRDRLRTIPMLEDFETIEECFLEYDTTRGSHIEAHIDDCWIWGERVVTVNCIGDTVLTLTKHVALYPQQYNLDLVEEYKNQLICPLQESIDENTVIRIPLPRGSLMVLHGPPRFQYEHAVLREDINSRRVAIAYREFTVPYQKSNPKYIEAEEIYKLSAQQLVD